eukprot:9352954-Lingulodinium_polyedra.AAC.1
MALEGTCRLSLPVELLLRTSRMDSGPYRCRPSVAGIWAAIWWRKPAPDSCTPLTTPGGRPGRRVPPEHTARLSPPPAERDT